MNAVIFFCLLVLCVTGVSSVTISTPAMQRKNMGESCNIRWNVVGNFGNYTIKFLSTARTTALGPNTNHAFNSSNGVITLFIWNIQTSNAGYYTLSIVTGPSTEVTSIGVLFVYDYPTAYLICADGRSSVSEGNKIELNCSVTSRSLPMEYQTNVYYYTWRNNFYGNLRNISSGPAVLVNGDILAGYSVKNEGKTLVIASTRSEDSYSQCLVQEQGSPYISNSGYDVQILGRPYAQSLTPPNQKFYGAVNSYIYQHFFYKSNPPLTSHTNWTFISLSGITAEYFMETNLLVNSGITLQLPISSVGAYGNYSITLTNSYGSTTETLQVLPPAPPDAQSNFSVQYVTHSLVFCQWRCPWFNGEIQAVFVRLIDAATKVEVETQIVPLATDCYNSAFSTIFQSNIQPETNYEASIWSTNAIGSSNVVTLGVRTAKRIIFDILPANISIQDFQATIRFRIVNSTQTVVRLNVTCCTELTTVCNNKSYIITNTDNQVVYDILPTGSEYVFDFTVYDTDGYTYTVTLAIVNGVRLSRKDDPTENFPGERNSTSCVEKKNSLLVGAIVLAVLLGVAVLALIGCLVCYLVCEYRENSSLQQSTPAHIPTRARPNAQQRVTSQYPDEDGYYESVTHVDPSNTNAGQHQTLESPTER